MLASRNAITRQTTNRAYVCLSCRTKAQKRRRHDGGETSRRTISIFADTEDGFEKAATESVRAGKKENKGHHSDSTHGQEPLTGKDGDAAVSKSESGRNALEEGPISSRRTSRQVFRTVGLPDPRSFKKVYGLHPYESLGKHPESLVRKHNVRPKPSDKIRKIADDPEPTLIRHKLVNNHLTDQPRRRNIKTGRYELVQTLEPGVKYRPKEPLDPLEKKSLYNVRPVASHDLDRRMEATISRHADQLYGAEEDSPSKFGRQNRNDSEHDSWLNRKNDTAAVDYNPYSAAQLDQEDSMRMETPKETAKPPEVEDALALLERASREAERNTRSAKKSLIETPKETANPPEVEDALASLERASREGERNTRSAKKSRIETPKETANTPEVEDALASLERASREGERNSRSAKKSLKPKQGPASFNGGFAWSSSAAVRHFSAYTPNLTTHSHIQARLLHTSEQSRQQAAVAVEPNADLDEPETSASFDAPNGIRAQLRQWQELHGQEDPMPDVPQPIDDEGPDSPVNNLTRLPDEMQSRQQDDQEEQQEAYDRLINAGREGFDGSTFGESRFLKMGDLVEIENSLSERENTLAIYVQRMHTGDSQFLTMQGKWIHIQEKTVQYSISGWISPKLVEPLLEHLPKPDAPDLDQLKEKAQFEDLSVPRELTAPLTSRLTEFYNESQAIYRRHASALDDAHNILAHDTDLRYGSLVSAATTLLRIPSDKLPLTALYTVRKALTNGGFAFSFDRRSHRLTGYMQIRSKDQVRMVEQVRGWLRTWQEDLATTAALPQRNLNTHKPIKGARIVYSFIERARKIVMENRRNRDPVPSGNNVGMSKTRRRITKDSDSVKVTTEEFFTEEEMEIVRFMEGWSCSNLLYGLPRLSSLPPLLLQATGLYNDVEKLGQSIGYMFLQELGTLMPYENRVRFDQHLLLPTSQHSKPLQKLMANLLSMKDNHDFSDSMAGLRHDWKDLPVYCIDDSGAHEIDDGISIESAGIGPNGKEQHWVHVHIANPTAFFSRDHPMAKMARHMGESIYMPERTYMMLPKWATQAHFSLGRNRPCLTISTKLNDEANILDLKITSGIIRNFIQLTPNEVDEMLAGGPVDYAQEISYTVGGELPPRKERPSMLPRMTEMNVRDLKKMSSLAKKRSKFRESAGGLQVAAGRINVSVWQNWNRPGLAWDHPYRKGLRKVEGDPVITYNTAGIQNWFGKSTVKDGIRLVTECMLLACETAARWCAERQIPVVYRGTVNDPGEDVEKLWREKILPGMREDGSLPMHLGVMWLQKKGRTTLATEPRSHELLGLSHFSKATSPLRRYGDMILHWQIEAALRQEAKTGKSLIAAPGENVDRSFLPFSKPVLQTILMGLQPREMIIQKAKQYSEQYWLSLLMFRKFHFQDNGPLPSGLPGKPAKLFIHSPGALNADIIGCLSLDMGTSVSIVRPDLCGISEPLMHGDVWEAVLDKVDVYRRATVYVPVRLVGREGAGIL